MQIHKEKEIDEAQQVMQCYSMPSPPLGSRRREKPDPDNVLPIPPERRIQLKLEAVESA